MVTEYIITNPISITLLGFAFCYFILYKFNKFLGNIGYVGVSMTYFAMTSQTGTTITAQNAIGFILVIGSIVKLIWETIQTLTK